MFIVRTDFYLIITMKAEIEVYFFQSFNTFCIIQILGHSLHNLRRNLG